MSSLSWTLLYWFTIHLLKCNKLFINLQNSNFLNFSKEVYVFQRLCVTYFKSFWCMKCWLTASRDCYFIVQAISFKEKFAWGICENSSFNYMKAYTEDDTKLFTSQRLEQAGKAREIVDLKITTVSFYSIPGPRCFKNLQQIPSFIFTICNEDSALERENAGRIFPRSYIREQ